MSEFARVFAAKIDTGDGNGDAVFFEGARGDPRRAVVRKFSKAVALPTGPGRYDYVLASIGWRARATYTHAASLSVTLDHVEVRGHDREHIVAAARRRVRREEARMRADVAAEIAADARRVAELNAKVVRGVLGGRAGQ